MALVEVETLRVLRNSYVYLLNHGATGVTAVVDPGTAGPIITAIDEQAWRPPKMLLCTNHHADQVGGNLELYRSYECEIYGPEAEADRIPGLTKGVKGGDKITLGSAWCEVIDLPGHTAGGVGYYFAENKALFCGDVLYPLGCGRILPGKAEEMWATLMRIRAMPPTTQIYCAHDYIDSHAKFARSLDRDNDQMLEYGRTLRRMPQQGKHSVPFQLTDEISYNPFLRADDPSIQAKLGMEGANPVDVLSELRNRLESR